MHELKYTLETVSLLFLAGANPRQEAKLRPLIFRGALRSWWHAALDGMIGDSDLAQLHPLENQLFSAAGGQEGASAIRLLLRLLAGVYLHFQKKQGNWPIGHFRVSQATTVSWVKERDCTCTGLARKKKVMPIL